MLVLAGETTLSLSAEAETGSALPIRVGPASGLSRQSEAAVVLSARAAIMSALLKKKVETYYAYLRNQRQQWACLYVHTH